MRYKFLIFFFEFFFLLPLHQFSLIVHCFVVGTHRFENLSWFCFSLTSDSFSLILQFLLLKKKFGFFQSFSSLVEVCLGGSETFVLMNKKNFQISDEKFNNEKKKKERIT